MPITVLDVTSLHLIFPATEESIIHIPISQMRKEKLRREVEFAQDHSASLDAAALGLKPPSV